jgi:hypothetical protein
VVLDPAYSCLSRHGEAVRQPRDRRYESIYFCSSISCLVDSLLNASEVDKPEEYFRRSDVSPN